MVNRRRFIIGSICLSTGAAFGRPWNEPVKPAAVSYRPLIHYAPINGFMNDPNGLVYYDGEYHLFYQYNPTATTMGNVHWGHAVSKDLLNWHTLPIALARTSAGQAFSGSAVVDKENTSKLFKDKHGGLVVIYTRVSASLQTQEIASSADRGRTFTPYSNNPVLDIGSAQFRDPKVFWYEPNRQWIMVVVASRDHRVQFYRSADLKTWHKLSEFADAGLLGIDYECPDLVSVPVEGGGDRWVLILSINPGAPLGGSTIQYFVGDFDGQQFIAEDHATRLMDFGKDFYAFQTFSGLSSAPVGLSWLSNWQYANEVPASPSRGMMTLPRTLGLRQVKGDWRLLQRFIDLSPLANKTLSSGPRASARGTLLTQALPPGEAVEVQLTVEITVNAVFTLRFANEQGEKLEAGLDSGPFGGIFIDRHATQGFQHRYFTDRFSWALPPATTHTDIHLVVDRASLELIADEGAASGTALYYTTLPFDRITLLVEHGEAILHELTIRTLHAVSSSGEVTT
ncbi:glycoside hydrolase family 32 protein [Erwinia pyrifoliae]|uniref:glycoside hydrolase family 32 protein n=1 Tax=Erwinia pyrifoliae TaxID=79967 RepID=UPI0001960FDD|nr:sucrose-6-phosphate hydrolase [Erwinia pyrifoliae]MCA8877013.1 glycoside hydrolase family 32 protein [Erwinia pyrifoliae]CAX55571.1 similar to levanase [Erwinia pyrifoliae Ep1/96]CAY74305.1 sucrose-6-phosphate hydrolase [Erwinia pyrifoliae DSM 12163]